MRCKACDAIMQSEDFVLNKYTNNYDELCGKCRAKVFSEVKVETDDDHEELPIEEDTGSGDTEAVSGVDTSGSAQV